MTNIPALTDEDTATFDIRELLDCCFAGASLEIEEIQIFRDAGHDIEILKAYTNWRPKMPYFGQIIVVLKYKNRLFSVRFHVWKEHQAASLANRITDVEELVLKSTLGHAYLDKIPTDFGRKAVWLHTPDSELDEESLALRSVAKVLKEHSISNQMCKKFRKLYQQSYTTHKDNL